MNDRWYERDDVRWICPPEERPTRISRRLFRGDTWRFYDQVFQDTVTQELFTVPVTSPPRRAPERAQPFNLTGCRVWVTAKRQVPDPDAGAMVELDNLALGGVVLISATAGTFSATAPPATFAGLEDSLVRMRFDVQVKDTGGNVFTVEYGELLCWPDVTRATT
jgi:hypothetical protein